MLRTLFSGAHEVTAKGTYENGWEVSKLIEVAAGGWLAGQGKKEEQKLVFDESKDKLGPINIGSCARVGANTVVLKDVPSYATMVGNPVKNININKDTSFNPYGVRDIDDNK